MALLASCVCSAPVRGEPLVSLVESEALAQTWVNAGFYSQHFQRDKGLAASNPGLGFEYRYSTHSALTAGRFHNSDGQMSNYAGFVYQPLSLGGLRLGAVLGAIDGYPRMRAGGWFPLVVPVVALEYKRVGFNLVLVPSYKDRLSGAVSLQLKLSLFD